MQLLLDACHMPPAFSQSGCVLKVDISIPDGLAEGAPMVPVDGPEPGVLVAGSLLVEPPVVPEGLLFPACCRRYRSGPRRARGEAMVPTRRANTNFHAILHEAQSMGLCQSYDE